MKIIPFFHVDAFIDAPFTGNPAGVCQLDEWLPDNIMQNIAAENNMAETAFIVPVIDGYNIRWFTPAVEVDLCGHATLASAHVVHQFLKPGIDKMIFHSQKMGDLAVTARDSMYELDFPTDELHLIELPVVVRESLGISPLECFMGRSDLLLLMRSEDEVKRVSPDFRKLSAAEGRGIIVTARGNDVDFVSRFFAPQSGIDEDPVTGSAHTSLAPFWSKRLGKEKLTARQLSSRGGYIECLMKGTRTLIAGRTSLYLKGEIYV